VVATNPLWNRCRVFTADSGLCAKNAADRTREYVHIAQDSCNAAANAARRIAAFGRKRPTVQAAPATAQRGARVRYPHDGEEMSLRCRCARGRRRGVNMRCVLCRVPRRGVRTQARRCAMLCRGRVGGGHGTVMISAQRLSGCCRAARPA